MEEAKIICCEKNRLLLSFLVWLCPLALASFVSCWRFEVGDQDKELHGGRGRFRGRGFHACGWVVQQHEVPATLTVKV